MKKSPVSNNSLRFIFVAAILMLLADHYLFGGTRAYIESAKQEAHLEQGAQTQLPPPVRVEPENGAEYFDSHAVTPDDVIPSEAEEYLSQNEKESPSATLEDTEAVRDDDVGELPAVISPKREGTAKVAIIIDDLGMDLKRSREIIDLPAPITLAFLPYGTKTRDYAKIGKEKGHELIIHTPMEAMDAKQNIGPGGLKTGMDAAAFGQNFNVMLNSFDGYVGINNHMGSKLTQDRGAMDLLMMQLKARGLFFVDSKTIGNSVAAKAARRAGIPYAERDVFLDHVDSRAFVDKALCETEGVALRKGHAIAIGHPKTHTIEGLRAWIPTLAAKGIELVPVSELLVRPSSNQSHFFDEESDRTNTDNQSPKSQPVQGADAPITDTAPEPDAPLLLYLPRQTELPAIY